MSHSVKDKCTGTVMVGIGCLEVGEHDGGRGRGLLLLDAVERGDGRHVVTVEADLGLVAAVEGRHQRRPGVGVAQPQAVAELVRGGLEQVGALHPAVLLSGAGGERR